MPTEARTHSRPHLTPPDVLRGTADVIRETTKERMVFKEMARVAIDSFQLNKIRFVLTAFGMVVGTASVILVVTIGLTGKTYVLNLIQGFGPNMIEAEYEGGGAGTQNPSQDYMTIADMRAVMEQVPGLRMASPMAEMEERIPIGGGKERDIQVLGVNEEYRGIRNLEVVAGRFFDAADVQSRAKVAVVTQETAEKIFSGSEAAVARNIKLSGLPFTIIGVVRERVYTFGQSELGQDTVIIPYTVAQYFTGNSYVKQVFFSAALPEDVPRATDQIAAVVRSRHRPESTYKVTNLTELLKVASKSANALTVVLLLVAAVTLIVSGVGIMNIMLANVSSRIREIGIRKAIGATRREIKLQFLTESVFIALTGGIIGTLIGLTVPFSIRFLTDFHIPISGMSAIIAIFMSMVVGVIFGTVPASRAAALDPIESLRYE
ncbi:MAG: ABC transporter permease [Acidobacteria bacterium]|nr:ABC transporter permease [Acidobacteriota bacterium]